MPNLALRNQSGVWYFASEFQSGVNGPAAIVSAAAASAFAEAASAARARPDRATAGMAAPRCFSNCRRLISGLAPDNY
jgi:hypothetical protein